MDNFALWHFLLTGTLLSIMTALRVGLGVAWVCVIAAEHIAAESGIGYMIMDLKRNNKEALEPDSQSALTIYK